MASQSATRRPRCPVSPSRLDLAHGKASTEGRMRSACRRWAARRIIVATIKMAAVSAFDWPQGGGCEMSDKIYDVPAEWAKRAWADQAKYQEMYARSVKDPDGFWAEQAKRI